MIKKTLATMLSAGALALVAAPQNVEQSRIIADPPPRKIAIAAKPTLQAFAPGKNNLEIVVAPGSNRVVEFAAGELGDYLKQSLGAAIPVVRNPTPGKVSIILGDNALSKAAGIDATQIARDGFIIKSKDGKVYIVGRDDANGQPGATYGWGVFFERGTLTGVYDFLERFLGVRFYFPGEIGTVVPRHATLMLPEMNISDRPDYPRRRIGPAGYPLQAWFPEQNYDHKKVAYCNYIWRMESFYVPCCHSLERLKFVERFGATNPEYFALDASGKRMLEKGSPYYGNLCYTDPGFRDELYKDAVAYLTGQPGSSRGFKWWDPSCFQPGFFNIMPKDHFKECLCPRCKKFYAEKSEAELVWDLASDIAKRLKKNGIKGYVTTMAYGHYPNPPQCELPDNMLVMVSVRGPWAENQPQARAGHDKRIQDWKKRMNRKPWLWSAVYKYGGLELPNVPATTPKAVAGYFTRQKNNISGTFMESESDHWIHSYLNYYAMSKSCWDNDLDYHKMIREHHGKMFGPAAKPMEQFFDRIEQLWVDKIAGRIVETQLGSQAIPPTDYELWEKIYSPEQFAFFDKCFAEAEKLAGRDKDALKRVRYFKEHFLGPIKTGAGAYLKTKQAVSNWSYHTRTLNHAPTSADWQSAPTGYLLPFKSDKAEVATTFKALADAKNLYFQVRCAEPEIAEMMVDSVKRDDSDVWRDSVLEFFLNPSGDRMNYLHFIINANGTLYDSKCRRVGASSHSDIKWNSKVSIKTAKEANAWTLDLVIPKSDLDNFNPAKFVANIGRHRVIRSKAAVPLYSFSPYIKGFHDLENFGTFDFTGKQPAPGLVENGDFGMPLKGRSYGPWHSGQKDIDEKLSALDTVIYRSAGQSLRVTGKDGEIKWGATQYLPAMKPNTRYELSFFVRTEDVKASGKGYQGAGGAVVNIGAPGNLWYPRNNYQGTMPWTRQGWIFTSGAGTNQGTSKAYIRLGLLHATGTVWFDDVQIRELPAK